MDRDQFIKEYQTLLWEEYLPFLEQNIVDTTYGGFTCHATWKGELLNTHKRTWFDGRGIWVYSYLFTHFGRTTKYLDIAARTVDLLLSIYPGEGHQWPWSYDEKGQDLQERKPDIYGNLFVAEGLTAYAVAIDDDAYWHFAKKLLLEAVTWYDSPTYDFKPHYESAQSSFEAPRVLGHWMILMRVSTQLLEQKADDDILAVVNRCIDALLNHHYRPKFKLMVEYLDHDLQALPDPWDEFVYIGHGIETAWMIMDEANRRGDQKLYDRAKALFKRHLEVAWDPVYGGVFHECHHISQHRWLLDKVLWAQEEVLVGLMLIISTSGDEWAQEWFERAFAYTQSRFSLKPHGIPLWNIGGNRQVDFEGPGYRIENYHHPRHLMLNLQRMSNLSPTF